jgi:hypothetical protein
VDQVVNEAEAIESERARASGDFRSPRSAIAVRLDVSPLIVVTHEQEQMILPGVLYPILHRRLVERLLRVEKALLDGTEAGDLLPDLLLDSTEEPRTNSLLILAFFGLYSAAKRGRRHGRGELLSDALLDPPESLVFYPLKEAWSPRWHVKE